MGQVTMPKMGEAMEEGTLIRWLKKEGDSVEENDPIAEVETDKAAMEIPSYISGKVSRLLIKEGESVPVGAPIAVILGEGESDNGAAPAEASPPEAKTVPAGQTAESEAPPQVGDQPAAVPPTRADAGQSSTGAATSAPSKPAPPAGAQSQGAASAEPALEDGARVLASPLARKMAAEAEVDLRALQGTGPKGRIIEADVRDYLQRVPGAPETAPAEAAPAQPAPSRPAQPSHAQPSPARPAAPSPAEAGVRPTPQAPVPSAAGEERKMSRIRQIIARRLTESKQTIPHIYLTTEIDMKAAREFLAQLKAVAEEERTKPSLTDMIIKACALALRKHPDVNAQFHGETIFHPGSINIGNAVALEDGLIVPVVRNCEAKTLHRIAGEMRPLIERARAGKLMPDEYAGGTFTITNLGMFDVESFAAIINPPEAAILAVGSILDQVVAMDGEVVVRPQMKVTLSADHRVIDGVLAAQFLQEVKRLLQTPFLLVE